MKNKALLKALNRVSIMTPKELDEYKKLLKERMPETYQWHFENSSKLVLPF